MRSIITDSLTGAKDVQLEDAARRDKLRHAIVKRIGKVPFEATVSEPEAPVAVPATRMTIGKTLALGPGSIITLDRLAGEPVGLLVNGTPIARGEVIVAGSHRAEPPAD